MMISKAMNAQLNKQITAEFGAAHNYLAMACVFNQMGLKVLAKRFFQQQTEESGHAMKIVKYILEVNGTVNLEAVAKPKTDYKTAEEIVQAALDSELNITRMINDLATLAESESDFATRSFLNWFIDEQVEEVSNMEGLLNLIRLAGKNVLQVEAFVRHEMMGEK